MTALRWVTSYSCLSGWKMSRNINEKEIKKRSQDLIGDPDWSAFTWQLHTTSKALMSCCPSAFSDSLPAEKNPFTANPTKKCQLYWTPECCMCGSEFKLLLSALKSQIPDIIIPNKLPKSQVLAAIPAAIQKLDSSSSFSFYSVLSPPISPLPHHVCWWAQQGTLCGTSWRRTAGLDSGMFWSSEIRSLLSRSRQYRWRKERCWCSWSARTAPWRCSWWRLLVWSWLTPLEAEKRLQVKRWSTNNNQSVRGPLAC